MVVGGVAISGGRGTLVGTLLGVALLGTIGPPSPSSAPRRYWERALQGVDHPAGGAPTRLPLARSACRRLSAPRRLPRAVVAAAASPTSVLLLALVVVEIAFFAVRRHRTSSPPATRLEVARASVEIGLLALALTPVILTGGIDLSVGSLLGLVAPC